MSDRTTTGAPRPEASSWSELTRAAAAEPWPTATLSPAARIAALAAGLPGVATEERILDAPFERVWAFVADLPRSVPTFDRDVASVRIVGRDGTRLDVRSTGSWRLGHLPVSFDVDLEPGWCWMVSRPRFYVVGMAAEPLPGDPGRTRYVHLEGLSAGGRGLGAAVRAARVRRHVTADVDGIERALRDGA